jgi:hypothetical protein
VDRFASELLEEALAQAVAHVQAARNEPGTRHVLAYDGYITLPAGERSDAIYAEGVEADSAVVMGLAQRYRLKRPLRKFEAVGNPMLLPPGSSKLA